MFFFPWTQMYVWAKSSYFLMRRVKIKPCQYFIKFQKEASWSFFLTLTQNDLSVLQEIYLGSKEECLEYYFQISDDFFVTIPLFDNSKLKIRNMCSMRNLYSLTSHPCSEFRKQLWKSGVSLQRGRSNFRTECLSVLQHALGSLLVVKASLHCMLQ